MPVIISGEIKVHVAIKYTLRIFLGIDLARPIIQSISFSHFREPKTQCVIIYCPKNDFTNLMKLKTDLHISDNLNWVVYESARCSNLELNNPRLGLLGINTVHSRSSNFCFQTMLHSLCTSRSYISHLRRVFRGFK